MNSDKKIGIIGYGMVGSAVGRVCHGAGYALSIFDKYKALGKMSDVTKDTNLIFVCVPTPTYAGVQDLDSLHLVLSELSDSNYSNPIIIKCTVLPGITNGLSSAYPNLNLFHNPEFLREKTAVEDFLNQTAVIISGKRIREFEKEMSDLFKRILPNAEILFFDETMVTEMGKYIHNVFLATKVAFFNQVYEYCNNRGISYEAALTVAKSQGGVGAGHTTVPGPDGLRGFGGSCFPKDTEALLSSRKSADELTILKEAVRYNKNLR